MQTRVDRVQRAVADQNRPRVLHSSGQYTAGNGTFVHDVIRIAGGRNIAAEAGIQGYETISDEVVVERDPEWIVHTGEAGDLADRAAYANTTAIRSNQTVVLDANLLSQPAPRVVVPVTRLAKRLHPEATRRLSVDWSPTVSHEKRTSDTAEWSSASPIRDRERSTVPIETKGPFPSVAALIAVVLTSLHYWRAAH
jgi:iron complex transport system substrate-binding protein